MSSDRGQKQIDFLLEHHAQFALDMDRLKETQQQQAATMEQNAIAIQQQAANIDRLVETVAVMQSQMEANRTEIREAIDNLIIANEVTRNLSETIGKLALNNSKRISLLESRSES